MAKKYQQVKPKVPKEVLFSLIGVFVVVLGLFLLTLRTNEQRIFDAYDVTAATITEEHPFYEVSYEGTLFNEGFKDILNEERLVILYLGSPLCSFCVSTIGEVEKYFYRQEFDSFLERIYYYSDFPSNDITSDRQAMLDDFPEIERTTPQMIAFLDGEIIQEYQQPQDENYARAVFNFFEDLEIKLENENFFEE